MKRTRYWVLTKKKYVKWGTPHKKKPKPPSLNWTYNHWSLSQEKRP